MKHWMSLAFILVFSPLAWTSSTAVLEETIFNQFQTTILSKDKTKVAPGFTKFEQKLFVDALEDLLNEGSAEAIEKLSFVRAPFYDLVEKLRLEVLKVKYGQSSSLTSGLVKELTNELKKPLADIRVVYVLALYEQELLDAGHASVIKLAKAHPEYFDISQERDSFREINPELLSDLFYKAPDITSYMNGEYVQSVKIFMFCRDNRLYPCLMVMKNSNGQPVRVNGELWNHKSLASSKSGLPSYTRNGNTPSGIFTIDSVMPVADQQVSYGKNRRMILNFVPKSTNETLYKRLLPESSQAHEWWQPSVTARDIGRNLFRIHGTGKLNNDQHTPYYPFMRTSGCIAQRENTYDEVTFNDQRLLLDSVMKGLSLDPIFENELKIKGILYLVEMDDKSAPVELADLHAIGIK